MWCWRTEEGRMSHRVVCWVNVDRVLERRDFLWQIVSVDQNQDLRKRSMAVRLCVRSTAQNSTHGLERRAASVAAPLLKEKSNSPVCGDYDDNEARRVEIRASFCCAATLI